MRILHVSSARTFGGGERHVADLCRGLQERGHEMFVALRPTNEWQHRLSFLPPENIMHVSIRNSFGVLSSIRIADFVKQNNIQVIHAHVARDYIPASIASLAAKPAKFVLTRHVLFPLKPFNKFALSNLAKAIAVSQPVANGLKKIFPPSKVELIHNGMNVEQLSPEEKALLRGEFRKFHNIPDDALVIGSLGELKELKGQRELILAAAELIKKNNRLFFVIVGKDNSGSGAFRRDLRRMVKVFGLEERFLWLDWLDDTGSFFSAIDVFVSPSHSESFGLAMLEAMAHGKPVVATATEGARELFGKKADLATIGEPIELSDRIAAVLADESERKWLGEANAAAAGNMFSLSSMVEKTEALYQKILG